MWQPAAVIYPDAELLVVGRLQTLLPTRPEPYAAGVHVGITVPESRPRRAVIVRRDGGTIAGDRDRPRMSLRVWGGTEQESTDLARLVQALLSGLPDGAPILRVEHLSGPTPIPDESEQPSRLLLVEIHTKGVAA